MLVETVSFKFDPSYKQIADPIKDKNERVISKGSENTRVVWNNAYGDGSRFNFAAKEKQELNFITKKLWKKIIIDGEEVLGNINSITNRFGISKKTVNESSPEELGALLKMIAARPIPNVSNDQRPSSVEEGIFIGNLVDSLAPLFKNVFQNPDGIEKSALKNNLTVYLMNKLIFNKESPVEKKIIEKFIPENTLLIFTRTRFIEAVNRQPRRAESERNDLMRGKSIRKINELEALAEFYAKQNHLNDPSESMINLFIYDILEKNKNEGEGLPNNVQVPAFVRLAKNMKII